MTETANDMSNEPAKSGKMPIIIGIFLAVAGAAGGFFAVQKGIVPLIPSFENHSAENEENTMEMHNTAEIAFVEIEPIMISLNEIGQVQHLRFRAQLEVSKADKSDVALLLPRVVDVLNGYLRALEIDDLREPMALTRLRGQMLRRIQIVVGKDRVRDLLIMEFVLN
ncbi:MAG: flagellar basal body-associated FliL family protein [Rhodobacteraceae bacterium]|nr:flagellar basal body-associated FliL family protein [Paracoccaceae bacterium]